MTKDAGFARIRIAPEMLPRILGLPNRWLFDGVATNIIGAIQVAVDYNAGTSKDMQAELVLYMKGPGLPQMGENGEPVEVQCVYQPNAYGETELQHVELDGVVIYKPVGSDSVLGESGDKRLCEGKT